MCFSATASLTAGTFLLGVGVMTTRMARTGGDRVYAAIPLLFAIQQLTEGVVWLSFGWGIDAVTAAATTIVHRPTNGGVGSYRTSRCS